MVCLSGIGPDICHTKQLKINFSINYSLNLYFQNVFPSYFNKVELAKQLEQKEQQLRLIMKDLEKEKNKTDTLLYSMLPREVANDLREGRTVEAGNNLAFVLKTYQHYNFYPSINVLS